MTPDATVFYGDAWDLALDLEPASIDCIVTSPPYFGLRDYGHPGQFGLEPTPAEYVTKLVDLCARLRPALKDEGTVWLNLGDSYAGGGNYRGVNSETTLSEKQRSNGESRGVSQLLGSLGKEYGVAPKNLVGIPWRVAFALQADGWYLRSDIIWSKPNPMPESVTDRPTKAHEYVFLFSKSQRYFFDADAVRERVTESTIERISQPTWGGQTGSDRVPGKTNGNMKAVIRKQDQVGERQYDGFNGRYFGGDPDLSRNIRTVWTIATQPYSGAHFAVFPQALAERCIKAGTSERGVCPVCGKAWERVVEVESRPNWRGDGQKHDGTYYRPNIGGGVGNDKRARIERGWQPTCDHDAEPIPATVLDPFAGSGTTLYVARKLGRNSVGFELNEDYRALIEDRLKQGVLC